MGRSHEYVVLPRHTYRFMGVSGGSPIMSAKYELDRGIFCGDAGQPFLPCCGVVAQVKQVQHSAIIHAYKVVASQGWFF